MIPPPPPPPSPDNTEVSSTCTYNNKKNKRLFVLLAMCTLCTWLGFALYHTLRTNGVPEVRGARGSTPGKVLNKLKTESQVKQLTQVQIQNEFVAVGDGAQEVSMDWKVFRFSPRTAKGTNDGVNGQNGVRTVSRGLNGNGKVPIVNDKITNHEIANGKNTSSGIARIHPLVGKNTRNSTKDIQQSVPMLNEKRGVASLHPPLVPNNVPN